MKPLPKVGIIYLTYPTMHWERDISRFMKSFEKINYPKDRLELICVESKGEGERVQPWFEKCWMSKSGNELPRISYLHNDEWIGFAGNNNIGLAKAKELDCEYVYLANEDTDTDPHFVMRAVERAELDPNIAIVQSLILLGEERDKINSIGNAYHYLGFGYSNGYRESAVEYVKDATSHDINYASGAGMLVRISSLEGEPLFDEKFYSYHEDTDAGLLARLKGNKVVMEPSSIIYHYYEFGKSKENFFWMERNRYVLLFSYYKFWTLFLLWPMICCMDAALFLFSIKSGWWRQKLRVYDEWIKPEYWRWIKKRRSYIQSVRKLSDKEFLQSAVSRIEFQEPNVKNPVLEKIGNPVMTLYWGIIGRLL